MGVQFQMDTRQLQIPRKTCKLFLMELIVNLNDLTIFSLFPLCLSIHILFFSPVQYQMEMMRSLRHVNIDHLHVGWYQSTYYGSFVSRALLDSQFSYQHAIEESVVLIYGEYGYNLSLLFFLNGDSGKDTDTLDTIFKTTCESLTWECFAQQIDFILFGLWSWSCLPLFTMIMEQKKYFRCGLLTVIDLAPWAISK